MTEVQDPVGDDPIDSSMAERKRSDDKSADHELGYEQARDELVSIVQRLETGAATLEESVGLWERGERLADICQAWLDGARARLDAAISADPPSPSP